MMQGMKDAPCGPPTQEVGHGQGGRVYLFSSFILLLLLLAAGTIVPAAPTAVPTEPAPRSGGSMPHTSPNNSTRRKFPMDHP